MHLIIGPNAAQLRQQTARIGYAMANNKVDYSLPWKIERILLELTDGTYDSDSMTATPIRPISISEIKGELNNKYNTDVSVETIRKILFSDTDEPNDSKPNQPKRIGELVNASLWCVKRSNKSNAKARYFVTRDFKKAETFYLLQLMCSTVSGGSENSAMSPLINTLSESDRDSLYDEIESTIYKANPFDVKLSVLLNHISIIQEAISKRRPINYEYLVNSEKTEGRENRIPLRIQILEGYPYLVEYVKAKVPCIMVRIDMMHKIKIVDTASAISFPDDYDKLKATTAYDFIRGAVNRRAGKIVTVEAYCHKEDKCKYVEDIFSGKESFKKEMHKSYVWYRFKASFEGTCDQAVKWADFFEIKKPVKLRNQVIERLSDNVYNKSQETTDDKPDARP